MRTYITFDPVSHRITTAGHVPEGAEDSVSIPTGNHIAFDTALPRFSEYFWTYQNGVVSETTDRIVPLNYQMQRMRAYPSVTDQLDALWKIVWFIKHQNGTAIGTDGDGMLDQILAVKQQYPAP